MCCYRLGLEFNLEVDAVWSRRFVPKIVVGR